MITVVGMTEGTMGLPSELEAWPTRNAVAFRILVHLWRFADHSQPTAFVYRTDDEVRESCGVPSRRAFFRAMSELRAAGLVERSAEVFQGGRRPGFRVWNRAVDHPKRVEPRVTKVALSTPQSDESGTGSDSVIVTKVALSTPESDESGTATSEPRVTKVALESDESGTPISIEKKEQRVEVEEDGGGKAPKKRYKPKRASENITAAFAVYLECRAQLAEAVGVSSTARVPKRPTATARPMIARALTAYGLEQVNELVRVWFRQMIAEFQAGTVPAEKAWAWGGSAVTPYRPKVMERSLRGLELEAAGVQDSGQVNGAANDEPKPGGPKWRAAKVIAALGEIHPEGRGPLVVTFGPARKKLEEMCEHAVGQRIVDLVTSLAKALDGDPEGKIQWPGTKGGTPWKAGFVFSGWFETLEEFLRNVETNGQGKTMRYVYDGSGQRVPAPQ